MAELKPTSQGTPKTGVDVRPAEARTLSHGDRVVFTVGMIMESDETETVMIDLLGGQIQRTIEVNKDTLFARIQESE